MEWFHFATYLAIATTSFWSFAYAQAPFDRDFAIVAIERVHYQFQEGAGGVPLLGVITGSLVDNRVKFTTCANTTIEIERSKLTKSVAKCRKKGDSGPFTTMANTLVPLYKAEAGTATSTVIFEGRRMALDAAALTGESKKTFVSARPGELVGYAFTTQDGKKAIGLLTNE